MWVLWDGVRWVAVNQSICITLKFGAGLNAYFKNDWWFNVDDVVLTYKFNIDRWFDVVLSYKSQLKM